MSNYFSDIRTLASEALRVEHFATLPAKVAHADDQLRTVYAWMKANGYDVVPVRDASSDFFVSHNMIADAPKSALVGHVMKPLGSEHRINSSSSLTDGLLQLGQMSWLLVNTPNKPAGIVTIWDLERPAVSFYLLAMMLTLEQGLRRLYGTYSHTPIPDSGKSIEDPTGTISRLFNQVGKESKLRTDLGFGSGRKFKKETKNIIKLRNNLAHGRSILGITPDPAEAVDLIHGIEVFADCINTLLVDREQIWEAYGETIIRSIDATSNAVWAGPNATELPYPDPLYLISAENPHEEVLSIQKNDERSSIMDSILKDHGLKYWHTVGASRDNSWSQRCFLVGGWSLEKACALGIHFGQRSVFELTDQEKRIFDTSGELKLTVARISK